MGSGGEGQGTWGQQCCVMRMGKGDLESQWSQPLAAARVKINTLPLAYLHKGLTQTFILYYGTRYHILHSFILSISTCSLLLCHTFSLLLCNYLTWESTATISENNETRKQAGVTAKYDRVAEVWLDIWQGGLTKPKNSSAMAPHILIHYILTGLRRQPEDRVTLIFAFFMETKKSHTPPFPRNPGL